MHNFFLHLTYCSIPLASELCYYLICYYKFTEYQQDSVCLHLFQCHTLWCLVSIKLFFFEFLFNSPFGKCWLIPALNAGRPRRRFCPTFCHSFWLLSNLIRNYCWSLILNISQMSNPIFFIYFKFLYFYDSFIVCFVYK